jgi:hypothetical protein
MDEQPTALDKLIGTSPHYAASTDYGIFCPACSDPFKLSFVRSVNCELAVNSATRSLSREEQYAPWREAMALAGLSPLSRAQYEKEISEHQTNFMRLQEQWKHTHRDPPS